MMTVASRKCKPETGRLARLVAIRLNPRDSLEQNPKWEISERKNARKSE
jgi:hypothetical protein